MIKPKENTNYLAIPVGEGFYYVGKVVESTSLMAKMKQVSWVPWVAEGGKVGNHMRAMSSGQFREVEPHDPEAESIFAVPQYTWHEWKYELPTKAK
jgi:hypothetical protein